MDSGSVTVGGADVRELDSAALMGQVAFVFQDTRLFKESLLEKYPGCPAGCLPGGGACRRPCRPMR